MCIVLKRSLAVLLAGLTLSCQARHGGSLPEGEGRILSTQTLILFSPISHGVSGGFNRIEMKSADQNKFREDFLLDADRDWYLVVEDAVISRGATSECSDQDLGKINVNWDWLLLDRDSNNRVMHLERVASISEEGSNWGRQYRVSPGSRYSLRVRVNNPTKCRSLVVEFRVRTETVAYESKHCTLYQDPFKTELKHTPAH